MEKNTFTTYAWITITALIMTILIIFASNYMKEVRAETERQVDRIIEMNEEEKGVSNYE